MKRRKYALASTPEPDSSVPAPTVCLACFHRQRSLLQPCQKCGSRRLAHVAFLRQTFGDEWELLLKAEEGKVH
ncbi:MAG: hypothetical protein ACJ754_01645 [Pyrinomonadaceae bacterium]